MCGLVGVFGNLNKELKNAFQDMLILDVLRGFESTGVGFITRNGTSVVKDACLPHELLSDQAYKKDFNDPMNIGLMGHNRWATKGKVTWENAHPFINDHITLAHNGTLTAQWRLKDHQKFAVDSENIAYNIAQEGVEATWKKLDGAAAISFWDEKTGKLYLCKNDKRPLTFAYLKNREAMVWASEAWMISIACQRNGVDFDKIYSLEDDKLYAFSYMPKKHHVSHERTDLQKFVFEYKHIRTHSMGGMDNDDFFTDTTNGGGKNQRGGRFRNKLHWPTGPATHIKRAHTADDPYARQDVRVKDIKEEEFHRDYSNCKFCANSLEHEYDICVIVGPHQAICNDCFLTAEANNMTIN